MSRTLEGIFVLGCALVGLSMNAPDGSRIQNAVHYSVQLIAVAQDNMASNAARLRDNLSHVPVQMLRGYRKE